MFTSKWLLRILLTTRRSYSDKTHPKCTKIQRENQGTEENVTHNSNNNSTMTEGQGKEIEAITSSLRVDAVAAIGLNISRK